MSKETLQNQVRSLKNSQSNLTLPQISQKLTGNVTAWLFGNCYKDLVSGYSMKASEWYSEAKAYLECYYYDCKIDLAVSQFIKARYEKLAGEEGLEPPKA